MQPLELEWGSVRRLRTGAVIGVEHMLWSSWTSDIKNDRAHEPFVSSMQTQFGIHSVWFAVLVCVGHALKAGLNIGCKPRGEAVLHRVQIRNAVTLESTPHESHGLGMEFQRFALGQ